MILFSLIIPVYNSESFLEECLLSCTKQNFNSNFHEVLIIDDGSTDKSALIAQSFCLKYDYFKLIRKENGGVSSARNVGLKNASGKYIAFLDSDDYVSNNLYLEIINLMEKNNWPCFYFGFTSDNKKIEQFNGNYYKVKRDNSVKAAVWRYVYSKKQIVDKNLFFDESIKYGEDFLFNYKFVLSLDDDVIGTGQCCLFYRLSEQQATYKIKKKDKNYSKIYCSSYASVCRQIKNAQYNSNDRELYKKSISSQMYQLVWGGGLSFKTKTVVFDFKTIFFNAKRYFC